MIHSNDLKLQNGFSLTKILRNDSICACSKHILWVVSECVLNYLRMQKNICPLKTRLQSNAFINSGRYRLRVGDFRFLFTKHDNDLIIAKISPRGDAYKN